MTKHLDNDENIQTNTAILSGIIQTMTTVGKGKSLQHKQR